MVQRVLLCLHGTMWALVVGITAWRTGQVPPELWAVLPVGVSAILVAFRADTATPPGSKRPETK